jgi:regulator of protease activity HflC (stomatin/prohibitin superfamily)
MEALALLAVAFAGGMVILIAMFSSIRIVREYERLVIFSLGRCTGARGPGIVWIWPLLEQAVRVDMRESFIEVPHQTSITKDNAPISIDFLIYWKVVDPVFSVLQVRDFALASTGIATTTLRAVIGDILLDNVLAQREHINQVLRTKLDEVTERWGVKVTAVEIREIVPPREVQDAMNRQMSAERSRRAMVTEADGQREAAIKVAEGQKQSAILQAEGDKQAAILQAEGQRASQALRAEGFAVALNEIYKVAHVVDPNTMTLQYLEALKALGASPSTKYIFPLEFTSLLLPLLKDQSSPPAAGRTR